MGWGPRLHQKEERKLNTKIHLFLLPDYRCNVISCFKFLLPCLSFQDGLDSQTLNQNKPFIKKNKRHEWSMLAWEMPREVEWMGSWLALKDYL